MSQKSNLVHFGWFVACVLYAVQAFVLMQFLAEYIGSTFYWIGVGIYVIFFIAAIGVVMDHEGRVKNDKEVCHVWVAWIFYIFIFTVSVALIFVNVVDTLKKSAIFGPDMLKSVLCNTPTLFVLLLQLVVTPSYRKAVLSLSVVAALDIFDGIEMLEIVLMQNERNDFDLGDTLENCIIGFACLSFILISFGLARHKFVRRGKVVKRNDVELVVLFGLLEILLTNVPFLILRIIVWYTSGYEASIFIAKNII